MQYAIVPKAVSRQFDDEVIVANFETGIYYSFVGTAADIWLGLQSGATVDEIADALPTDEGGIDVRREVENFVQTLLAESLLVPRQTAQKTKAWIPEFSPAFARPVLDRFDDLQELLFLDPVHDVSEEGWPSRAQDDAR